MKRAWLLLATMTALNLGPGCGGDDDSGGDKAKREPDQAGSQATAPAPSPSGGKQDPAGVFQEFQRSLADGDAAKVCGLLTASATRQVTAASIGGSCQKWVGEVSGAFDPASKNKLRATKILNVATTGDRATLKYMSPILNIPLEVELQRSGGTWKLSKLSEAV